MAQAKRVEPNPNSEAARSFALTLGRLRLASDRDAWIRDFEGVLGNTSSWDPERRGVIDDYPSAIAAAVSDAFTQRDLNPRDDAGQIVAGAVKLAFQIAEPGRRSQTHPFGWNTRNPRLIDPVIMFVDWAEATSRG